MTQMPRTNFRSPNLRRLHIKFGQAVLEKMFEIVDGDGRRTMGIL